MLLQPLKCSSCGANLTIAPQQVLASCEYCHTGYEVLGTNAVCFAQSAVAIEDQPGLWLPFWLVRFDVNVRALESTAPANVFDRSPGDNAARGSGHYLELFHALTDQQHTMLVAAFKANNFINYTADLSLNISKQWDDRPLAQPGERMPWPRCYYNHLDARKFAAILLRVQVNKQTAEFIEMEFDTQWKDHQLVWWPFADDGDCWKDMVFGERILKSALPSIEVST